jgi:hypothetical protein
MSVPFRISREVYVPQLENGTLHYTIMEIVAASDADSGWAVKDKPTQPYPTATEPSVATLTTMDGLEAHGRSKGRFQGQQVRGSWTGESINIE